VKRAHRKPVRIVLSPCQIVAWNLEQARRGRGWSQEEAAGKLEPFIGYRITRAALSQAERCLYRGRIRRFDADEIVAYARAFDLPVSAFFCPPEPHLRGRPVFVNGKPGAPRANVISPPLTRSEMMRRSGRALMPNTNASAREIVEVFARAAQKGVRDYLERHPEALPMIASGRLPDDLLTPAEEEKMATEAAELVQKSPPRRRKP
jgi:hypothetical protein